MVNAGLHYNCTKQRLTFEIELLEVLAGND
jgi:hypothetical protein